MIIEETQHSGITRVFHLAAEHRERWIEFFDWLVLQGEIVSWRILSTHSDQ
jgi:hypothetical protein